ncbi:potassium-transporting ATPase subunit KdpB [Francisella adeliensis]|uniref:Potassium-transporting ATPase ATP-binding subunit n=1 Tax=Francisella adeliensis TaxID=2007306 RepID=A0A2Z4Y1H5_9GAMM|nr:potassium-transporting ATPase subunit KdpB [Francisella adeliensis]AXA34345.1 K(+)-transporting ATPase subunit B [Francisella adeliensis]MBK2084666.1 potassium-transporting ATPase subunit KdpB [Francisella adeliensis]MBK2096175.1 potassium-transporting ATPase subunit KdpB [Francisella adeliensis]QIW12592.1 potassium-transporting ATPase subunit KdpB [Francisella adeliensis]QIW14465.1 potassium-transporting ATPase subunit KdpB [Francisella adeliensis]
MNKKSSMLSKELVIPAILKSFTKCNPKQMVANPVMFCVEVVTLLCSVYLIGQIVTGQYFGFTLQVVLWLWFTILFANFAEAIAEGRGKAQADTLKAAKSKLIAIKVDSDGNTTKVDAESLRIGDVVLVETNCFVPCDGDVVEGMATIDESAITGESEPVVKESGSDNSAVTAGTKVVSDSIKVKVTSNPGESFLDKMIDLVENAKRMKSPNEIALTILLSGLTLIFIFAVCSLYGMAMYSNTMLSVVMLIALFVTLIPTTIAGLLSAVGISGMDRLLKFNIVALSGRAVESSGSIDLLLLDKTGTITLGNRFATEFIPVGTIDEQELAYAAWISSLSDETPEGKSIVKLAEQSFEFSQNDVDLDSVEIIPFSAYTRMSGIDYDNVLIRKGAISAIEGYLGDSLSASIQTTFQKIVETISEQGGTPLAVAQNNKLLGVIYLKDIIKPNINERFAELRKMGVETVMITGDNPLTAASIAAEAGVDDYIAQASPKDKLDFIIKAQKEGKTVAMCGDGTNDAPALAQADVGIAMASGTSAAREAGNMVDLDSDPKKIIEIVKIGKQILVTRGALTTFSITNDIAKYFVVIPALFVMAFPSLNALNIMHLHSSESAILSAVIFNALIIIFLIPMALIGVKSVVSSAQALLRKNMLVYGLGGVIVPFIGIKLIDMCITMLHLV